MNSRKRALALYKFGSYSAFLEAFHVFAPDVTLLNILLLYYYTCFTCI